MKYDIVPLIPEDLDRFDLLRGLDRRAYFTTGSAAVGLLVDGEIMLVGGLVNLQWNRAEAWIIPNPFFRAHLKTCLRAMKKYLPLMAAECGFRRVQATCVEGIPCRMFAHLGFHREGMMHCFGPNGENCSMWSRVFEP